LPLAFFKVLASIDKQHAVHFNANQGASLFYHYKALRNIKARRPRLHYIHICWCFLVPWW
jgi:hypothetical protein